MSSMLYEIALLGRETFHKDLTNFEFSDLPKNVKDEMFSCWKRNLHRLADSRSSFESEMGCGRFLFSDCGEIYDCGEDGEWW